MKTASQNLLSLAALLPAISAQAVVGAGIVEDCPDVPGGIVYQYPAVYSTVIESAATIFNFMGGTNSLVISNAPTTIITTTTITTTVSPDASNTITSFSQVPPPAVTAGPDITYTTTGADGSATVVTTTQPSATLGQGLAGGTVTQISQATPIIIGFAYDFTARKRQAGASVDGYVSASSNATDDCSAATVWYLVDGQLVAFRKSGRLGEVGRMLKDDAVLFKAYVSPMEVNTTLSFVNGILQWNTADKGFASFYQCPDGLYASFVDSPPEAGCTGVILGGVVARTCPAALQRNGFEVGPMNSSSTSMSMSASSTGSSSQSTSSTTMTMSGSSSMSSSMSSMSGSSSSGSGSSSTGSGSGSSTSGSGSSTSGSSSSSGSSSMSSTGSGSGSSTRMTTTTNGSGSSTMTSTSSSASATSDGMICPSLNGTDVDSFTILCGWGINGADIPDTTQQVDDLSACLDLCANTDTCVSVSFKREDGTCYLHASAFDRITDYTGDFDSAELASVYLGGGESSSTTTTDDGSSSTTTEDSSSTTTTDGGAGTTTSTGGAATTTTTSGGAATTTTTTTSAPTTTTTSTTSSTTTSSTTTTTTTTTSASVPAAFSNQPDSAQCSASNPPADYTSGSKTFKIFCGKAISSLSPDINPGGTQEATLSACMDLCAGTTGCVSISFDNNGAGPHPCYMHTSDASFNANIGYHSAIIKGTSGDPLVDQSNTYTSAKRSVFDPEMDYEMIL